MSEEFGIFKRLLESAVKNIAQSYYDDFSKKNASFRSASGLGTKVIRKDDGKCCEWCSDLSGTYDYDDRPDEIFRRHRNCTCTVVVKYTKDGKTRYTDVYDKKDYVSEKEARIAQAKKMEELDKLSHKEKIDRRAAMDAEYSRNYRKGMTQAQKDNDLKRKRDAYHEKNPDAKYLTGGKYEGRDPLNSPATLNGKTGKQLENEIKTTDNGRKPDFYVGITGKTLKAEYSEWIGENKMEEYLNSAETEITKRYIKADFRKTSFIGDGSTAAIRKFEIETGLNCGRNGGNHAQKVDDLISQIKKALLKVESDNDKILLKKMLNRLLEVKN